MKLSKQRIIYLGLLGLGLTAFAVDRLFFAPAGAAAAESAPAADAPRTSSPSPRPDPADPAPSGKPFSERLRQVMTDPNWDRSVADGFVPPPSWAAGALMGPPAPEEAPHTVPDNFAQRHKVTMVVSPGRSADAADRTSAAVLIDGKLLRIGERLDGFELVSIDPEGAVFATPTGNLKLLLPRPETRSSPPRHDR